MFTCTWLLQQTAAISGVGGSCASAPPKVFNCWKFGQNPWKYRKNPWKCRRNLWKPLQNPWKSGKNVWQCPFIWKKDGVLFGGEAKTVLMRKYSHKNGPTIFLASFGNSGKNPSQYPTPCLLLHLWLQSHRPQKLEVELVSLACLHCHAYRFGLLLYCCRFVQYGLRNFQSTLKQLWKCFIVSPLWSACLVIQ